MVLQNLFWYYLPSTLISPKLRLLFRRCQPIPYVAYVATPFLVDFVRRARQRVQIMSLLILFFSRLFFHFSFVSKIVLLSILSTNACKLFSSLSCYTKFPTHTREIYNIERLRKLRWMFALNAGNGSSTKQSVREWLNAVPLALYVKSVEYYLCGLSVEPQIPIYTVRWSLMTSLAQTENECGNYELNTIYAPR